MKEILKKVLISPKTLLKDAIKQMDKAGLQILVVTNKDNQLLGVITDGDIRRAIIKGFDFNKEISLIMTKKPIVSNTTDKKTILNLIKKYSVKQIPIVDKNNKIIDLILWKDILENKEKKYNKKNNKVVIMAGGKGTRLDPFTKILPKPLIPIGEKPIIEVIIENFHKFGFNNFILSLNYKADMIKAYFSENIYNYHIEYIQEEKFLGTAGSLYLLKDKIKETFLLSNSDIIINANFDNLINFHKSNNNSATILGVIRNIKIPYGILEINKANLDKFIEKPEFNFIINSGIYVLEPQLITLIKENQPLDIPQLLTLAKKTGLKIQVYPVNCTWFDIGEWEEYKKALEYINRYSI